MSESVSAPTKVFFREAMVRAIDEEMARDRRVFVMGQDVGVFGGSYREFDGLFAKYGPGRVRDTPVAENATIGIAAGAAAAGLRPLACITYMDFVMLGLDPLINYAAKLRYKTGNGLSAPVVVKTTAGALGQGVAHSQCLEAWLMNVPGLDIVAPSTPADAYGLMKSALRSTRPVVYIDHKRLFPLAGEIPIEETLVPFGKAVVRRPGVDVTISAYSFMVRVALEAARRLEQDGVSCEVIDLRSLAPLDMETVADSVARTGALVTLEEGQSTCGTGAEIAARLLERGCVQPWSRVCGLPAPVSSNPVFEAACVPDPERIVAAVRTLLARPRYLVERADLT